MTGYLAPYMTRLLIAVHDHRDVESGVEWGRAMSAALHLPITFVSVVDGPTEEATAEQLELMAHDMLEIVKSDARLRDFEVDHLVLIGDPAERLPELAESQPGALLILAIDREPGSERSMTQGSRMRRILRNMRTFYMLIPVDAEIPRHIHSVVVGYDRSELSSEVVRIARVMAGSLDVDVISVEAIEPDSVSPEAFAGHRLVMDDRRIQARGLASRTLQAVARARDAAVIVVGSHGLGTSPELLMGRTSEWLSRHSDRPVIIVPQNRQAAGT